MATVQSVGWWTLRFSGLLALVPVVEVSAVNRFWGYGLLCLALVATWAAAWRWQRHRQYAEPTPSPFWREQAMGEISETIDVARDAEAVRSPERRERAMRNLMGSIRNEGIEADLRIQLIQDLVDLGGKDMAMRLTTVVTASDVDIEVRLEAAEHMGRFSADQGMRALELIATDASVDDRYRLDAASALVDCAAGAAEIALMQLVADNRVSEYVRHGAANMLRLVDRSSASTAFRHLATAPHITSRLRIICAEQLADDNPAEAERALWRLIKGIESTMDYNLGLDAAETLHGIRRDSGIEAYSALAVDANFPWYGRIEAAYRLGKLGVSDGFDLLSDFASAEGLDDVHGLAALDRLFQLEVETGTLDPDD
ncbi:hypothetical protein GCM10028833_31080 [Glycomyces tarimensis]